MLVILLWGKWKWADPWCSLDSQPSLQAKLQASEKLCLWNRTRNDKQGTTPEAVLWSPYSYSHRCTHTYIRVYMHIHTHTHSQMQLNWKNKPLVHLAHNQDMVKKWHMPLPKHRGHTSMPALTISLLIKRKWVHRKSGPNHRLDDLL